MLTLTTHAQKVTFLTKFVNGELENFDRTTPLMIIGSGGNGKSKVIHEISEKSPSNILILYEGGGFSFLPSKTPSDICVILFHAHGTSGEYALGGHLNANCVKFEKDPSYEGK